MIYMQVILELYPTVETMINSKIKELIKKYSVTYPDKFKPTNTSK